MCTANVAFSVVRKCRAIRTSARIIQGKDGDGYGMVLTLRCKTCFIDRTKILRMSRDSPFLELTDHVRVHKGQIL